MDFEGNFFKDVPDSLDFSPITPGIYTAALSKVPEKSTSSAGNEVLKISLIIQDEGEFQGRSLMDSIPYLMDFGKVKLKNLFKSAGFNPDDGVNLEELVGEVVTLQVVNKPYRSSERDSEGNQITKLGSNVQTYVVK